MATGGVRTCASIEEKVVVVEKVCAEEAIGGVAWSEGGGIIRMGGVEGVEGPRGGVEKRITRG